MPNSCPERNHGLSRYVSYGVEGSRTHVKLFVRILRVQNPRFRAIVLTCHCQMYLHDTYQVAGICAPSVNRRDSHIITNLSVISGDNGVKRRCHLHSVIWKSLLVVLIPYMSQLSKSEENYLNCSFILVTYVHSLIILIYGVPFQVIYQQADSNF